MYIGELAVIRLFMRDNLRLGSCHLMWVLKFGDVQAVKTS